MRILLKGYYGFGNLGDDILLKTTWQLLKNHFGQADISVFSNFNENLSGYNQVPHYNQYIHKIVGTDAELIDWTYKGYFDLVVDGGGGVYFDYKKGGVVRGVLNALLRLAGAKNVGRIDNLVRKILNRKKHLQYARRIAIGLGIGPYTKSSPTLYYHLTEIGSTDAMFVRDTTSIEWLTKFKFRGKKFCFTDLAFISSHWWPMDFAVKASRSFEKKIGIILLDWHEGNEERFRQVKEFATWAGQRGYAIQFFSFDENTDKEYIQSFSTGFDLKVWRPNETTLDVFLAALAHQNIIFSARAHGAILSSMLGVPSVCIGTSLKLVEVSKMFPKSSKLLPGALTQSDLRETMLLIEKEYQQRIVALAEDVANNQLIADRFIKKLDGILMERHE